MRTEIPCAYCTTRLTDDPTRDRHLKCESCSLEGPLDVMRQLSDLRVLTMHSSQVMLTRREKVAKLDASLKSCGAKTCIVMIGDEDKMCACSLDNLLEGIRVRSQQLAVVMGDAPASKGESS